MTELKLATPKGYTVAKDLRTSAADLQKTAESIVDFVGGKLDQISNEIVAKSEELEALEIKLMETKRVKSLDLELAIRRDKQEAFQQLAGDLGFAVIPSDQLVSLKTDLEVAQASNGATIDAAVKSAEEKVRREMYSKLHSAESEYKVATAKLEADNQMYVDRCDFLQKQIERLDAQLSTAQDANVRIAEASKGSVINTGK